MNLLTKGDLVTAALRKLAVANDATLTDIEPSSFADATFDLEMMMAEWALNEALGLDVGYLFAAEGVDPDPGDAHGLETYALKPVIVNLAVVIAPDYGVMPSELLTSMAQSGYEMLVKSTTWKRTPCLRYRNRVPIGSGNRIPLYLGINYFHDRRKIRHCDDDTDTTTTG